MYCYSSPCHHIRSFWRSFRRLGPHLSSSPEIWYRVCFGGMRSGSVSVSKQGYSNLSSGLDTNCSQIGHATPSHSNLGLFPENEGTVLKEMSDNRDMPDNLVKLRKNISNLNLSNDHVMLIDGTSVMFRSYYKIIAMLHRGKLENADGNGDWVLTIFRALSSLIEVLEFNPSHVAVVFDHDGVPYGQTSPKPSKECYMAKGLTFRHNLYPLYKGNRNPTPDTVVQGLQYLKASIKAMSINVIEVPGVEADDVIGTLAVNCIAAGYKVQVVSPDKDFFQILSPSLRLLRLAPRGSEMVSFGIENFVERYGDLKPSQFVDLISLVGDKSDNIPGVNGIGEVNAVKLIAKFGSLENLLQCIDEVEEDRIKKALISDADTALLSKELATLRCDLPSYMVPCKADDLVFGKPKDNGEKFMKLMRAIGAYAEGFSAEPIIGRVLNLWERLEDRRNRWEMQQTKL
ncbi:hypothetical protein QJS10_CPA16g00122 [Acorus calamus]|uniref:5'-3' exonuclease domain-containing protein n=1 Tax=Acorus calamus TaxID=4465 RepID=A0AAV9CZL8_ACOCL|nr:hypothetical protein QJS10_CPA16g00122 [Acorus calamus]